ncbi:outer membrane protein assembly factor BamD [Prevotella intermedia]|jgi:outer membrane assembly lipoprotein yfiO|uniref:Outer membrane lipoprotein with TPR domain n=1 Tax=Prevotella intermedia TaxID=28131 RepID=A0A0S3UHT3_PREIN|nr:outer membrane protein assembly factor BamD [Prevotella intermedia]APW32051.1 outer membrane protein assembly factor BamD [Prevotella intermedia ATCC 25611 = DSM 20706]ATV28455.1 outer membrane protein assembly factor BamD [Prevotella intermedia]ATV54003.1 outer membrane protein assembly factor BamD [Prevotella intermedia]AWX06233.1 outer membrane protein assembly factor BamD [Prevotella intermedia]MCK6143060.1 outer membrane protein assembly factor BamD [Prevotella intermedia]
MKKNILITFILSLLLTSCAQEYNQVYKSTDHTYKYEYAKECFAKGKYSFAVPLLQDLVTIQKGTDNAQECLYMLAMAEYGLRDYQAASEAFKKYYQTYPNGEYAEMASFYIGQSLYEGTPEPRLDQTPTVAAIAAFQDYLDLYPNGKMKGTAQQRLFALQDKLIRKEYLNAKLYYNLGSYFGNCGNDGGNNYEACIITAQNALNDFPYSSLREDFAILVMKGKYELAQMSVEEKKVQRYQDAEDECYGFINEYPDSKERSTAEKYIEKCKQFTAKAK